MNDANQSADKVFLTFTVAAETFAVPVGQVAEILEVPPITVVPQAPPFMKGIINLRGNVLPVIDTRMKFGIGATETGVNTVIIVLNIHLEGFPVTVGILVDSANEVLDIPTEKVSPLPTIGARYRTEYIQGVVEMGNRLIMLLDIDRVFSTDELNLLQSAQAIPAEAAAA